MHLGKSCSFNTAFISALFLSGAVSCTLILQCLFFFRGRGGGGGLHSFLPFKKGRIFKSQNVSPQSIPQQLLSSTFACIPTMQEAPRGPTCLPEQSQKRYNTPINCTTESAECSPSLILGVPGREENAEPRRRRLKHTPGCHFPTFQASPMRNSQPLPNI